MVVSKRSGLLITRWWIIGLTIAALIFSSTAFQPSAHGATDSTIQVYADKQRISFDIDPIQQAGTTLVQLRPLFEALGIELTWNQSTRTVHGKKGSHTFSLPINSKTATVNGKTIPLTRAATVHNGHTIVPIRFVGEATGAVVGWHGQTRTIQAISEEYRQILGINVQEAQKIVTSPVANEPSLHGLYARWSMDLLGVRGCASLCWDYYYFTDGNRVITEIPEGGIDALNLTTGSYLTYQLRGNVISFSDGTSYSFERGSQGELIIDELSYQKYDPQHRLTLDGTYKAESYISHQPGVDIVLSNTYIFNKDGTFIDTSWTGVITDGSNTGTGTGGSSTITNETKISGTYAIVNYTMLLQYADGSTAHYMFFLPDQPSKGIIQLGGADFVLVD